METDIASLYKSKHASLKFEVVCILSNAFPRYWLETKVSKTKSIKVPDIPRLSSFDIPRFQPVAQGQYVVSDTRCPALYVGD